MTTYTVQFLFQYTLYNMVKAAIQCIGNTTTELPTVTDWAGYPRIKKIDKIYSK